MSPLVKNGISGQEIEKKSFFTSSPSKRDDYIGLYSDKGYILAGCDCITDRDIPNGFEDKVIVGYFWAPNITTEDVNISLAALPHKSLEEEKSKNLEPIQTIKEIDHTICSHKYNCSAHKDICMKQYGMPSIKTQVPSRVNN